MCGYVSRPGSAGVWRPGANSRAVGEAGAVPEEYLRANPPALEEHEQVAGKRILTDPLPRGRRQAVEALAHVRGLQADEDANRGWERQHDSTVRMSRCRASLSKPAPSRIDRPLPSRTSYAAGPAFIRVAQTFDPVGQGVIVQAAPPAVFRPAQAARLQRRHHPLPVAHALRHDAPPVHASCQPAAPRRQMQFTERLPRRGSLLFAFAFGGGYGSMYIV